MGPRSLVLLALWCGAAFLPVAAGADAPAPDAADATVATLAGSGFAGLRDGPAAQAAFMMPVGVAAAPDGAVLVADAGAQRVRRIDEHGEVTTLAGSGAPDAAGLFVPGGFRDGPAHDAQFDHPSGLAVARDGAILVADRLNHCVRRLAAGIVTTFAGDPREPGSADGERSAARFNAPTGVAFDRAGNLYVSDLHNGVRKVDAAGRVTTLTLPNGRGLLATSVSTAVEDDHDILYTALESGVVRMDLTAGTSAFYASGMRAPGPFHDDPSDVALDGNADAGTAFGVTSLGEDRFIYTDMRNNAVRAIWGRQARLLAGSADAYAAYSGASYRNGGGTTARFDEPMGIARLGPARFAVADAGNRRIRLVTLRLPQPETFDDLAAARGFYRIVYIGNSYVDYEGDTQSSIGALLESELRRRASALRMPRPPRVFTVRLLADTATIGAYVRNYYPGVADLVIWQVNAAELGIPDGIGAGIAARVNLWGPVLERELHATRDALAAHHTAFVAALNPMPWELSPVEDAYQRTYDLDVPPFEQTLRDGVLLRDAFARADVPSVDMFPAFALHERDADRTALFSAYDHHFSNYGRTVAAEALAAAVERLAPWAAR